MKKESQTPENRQKIKEHQEKWQFAKDQPQETQEAWQWVAETPESYVQRGFQSETREQASRRFFQVWNALKGKGTSNEIKADEPLRCTIWRARIMKFEKVMQDLIMKAETGLIAIYTKALDAIYPELETRAQSDPVIAERLKALDALLGRGRYQHEGLGRRIEHEYEVSMGKERARAHSPADEAVKSFYRELGDFPGLQEKYLNMIVDDVYTDFEKKVGDMVLKTGYYTGSGMVGGNMRSNKLLTFYLMQDPYPFLKSIPAKPDGEKYKSREELVADHPEGAPKENPIIGVAGPSGEKTMQEYTKLVFPNGTYYIKNAENPAYDFASFSSLQIRDQEVLKRQVRKMVGDLQRQAMFGQVYLAKNVFQNASGFEDKESLPGISLLDLGREGSGLDIPEDERDLTQGENGGLFWVPKKGLPNPLKKKEPKQNEAKAMFPPSKSLFAQSLLSVFGQATGDIWIDDKGNAYDSQEQIEQVYAAQDWEVFKPQLRGLLKSLIHHDLMRGGKKLNIAPKPSPKKVLTPKFEPKEIEVEEPEEKIEVPEEELALAAERVVELVKKADELDKNGLHKQAEQIDNEVQQILENMKRIKAQYGQDPSFDWTAISGWEQTICPYCNKPVSVSIEGPDGKDWHAGCVKKHKATTAQLNWPIKRPDWDKVICPGCNKPIGYHRDYTGGTDNKTWHIECFNKHKGGEYTFNYKKPGPGNW